MSRSHAEVRCDTPQLVRTAVGPADFSSQHSQHELIAVLCMLLVLAERRRSSDPRFSLAGFRAGSFRAAGGAAGMAPRAQVRGAIVEELLSQRRFTQLSFYLQAFFSIPQLAVVIFYSVKYGHKWNSCDRPINLWLVLYGIKLMASTVVSGLPLLSRPRWHPRGEAYGRLHDTVNLFGFVVFIFDNFWSASAR